MKEISRVNGRVLKFRAWDEPSQSFVEDAMPHKARHYKQPLMQYTGIKDKNGRDIYEGDIIKVDDEIVEVKPPELFECDAFVIYGYDFCSRYFIDNYSKVGLDRFYSYNPEIIGNVWENPELLT